MAIFQKVKDTPADAAAVRSRPIPREKDLSEMAIRPCPHCGGARMVFHCNDKVQCTWLRCVSCQALIEPSDWSHAYTPPGTRNGHGRTTLRNCHGRTV